MLLSILLQCERGDGSLRWRFADQPTGKQAGGKMLLLADDKAVLSSRRRIVALSLGGAISTRYAGLYPDNVLKLVNIEGFGMSPADEEKRRAMTIERDDTEVDLSAVIGTQPENSAN